MELAGNNETDAGETNKLISEEMAFPPWIPQKEIHHGSE